MTRDQEGAECTTPPTSCCSRGRAWSATCSTASPPAGGAALSTFESLAPLPASFVGRELQQRHGDLIWRVRFRDDRWLYLVLLLEQGIEQGRREERALLCRLAARKFDAGAGEGLAAALAGVTDPDRLARVGDWIIECATASELLARVHGDNWSGG